MCDGDAIVRHGHALGTALFHTLKHEPPVEHATAAMDNEVIASHVVGKILTGHNIHH